MGRRGRGTAVKGRKERSEVDEDLEEGLGRVHNQDFLKLDVDASDSDSEDEMENPVMDLQESESEEDDDDEEDDDLSDRELKGLEAKLMKTAQYMKRKVGMQDDEDDDDERKEEEEKSAWGKSKRSYYSADNVDYELQSSDEEAPAEEEAEVRKLQRKAAASLRLEDYEQYEDDEDKSEGERTLQEIVEGTTRKGDGGRTVAALSKDIKDVAIEKVEKNLEALTKEEKMSVVMSDAPELVGLLNELREGLDELRTRVQPLVHKVKDGQFATKDGISYLEVKNLLLLSYCQCIIFYLMLKAEGRPVRDHPVINRLVELRLYIEKIRPIDKKLQYQIDKLLKVDKVSAAADDAEGQNEDALKLKPNPGMLVSKLDEDMQDGVYKPPMIAPMAMDGDHVTKDEKAKIRTEKESRRKASRSSFIKELANELEGRPEEVRDMVVTESRDMMREKERLEARAKEEEELFTRVPLSRAERKKLKNLKKSKTGLRDLLDDFDDNLADLVGMDIETPASSFPEDLIKPRKRLTQLVAESSRPSKKQKLASGDADIPMRDDLGERRRKHEFSKQSLNDTAEDVSDLDKFEPEEDEFYKEAKEQSMAKKAAKLDKHTRPFVSPYVEEDADGKRLISNMMEKNRGLTPHRKKLTKNPRKKYKLKHEKAVIRRKGQIREHKSGGGTYGGETTGIRTGISRSVRF